MIYRHLDPAFIPDAIAGRLPPFDAFDWQNGHIDYPDVSAICERYNARADRYVQVLSHPCPEWVGGDAIVNYVAKSMPILTAPPPPPDPTGGGAPEGKRAYWPSSWFGCVNAAPRWIIDWRLTDTAKIIGFAATIKSECDRIQGRTGARLDIFYPTPDWWMFDSRGALITDFPANDWQYWTRRKVRFRSTLQSMLGRDKPIIVNGDWANQQPIQLENAHWWGRWDAAVDLWHRHEHALLSTNANYSEWVDRLIALHDRYPHKWVSLTGNGGDTDVVNDAYERLAA